MVLMRLVLDKYLYKTIQDLGFINVQKNIILVQISYIKVKKGKFKRLSTS